MWNYNFCDIQTEKASNNACLFKIKWEKNNNDNNNIHNNKSFLA